jgi:signal transduction histidine kinase
MSNAIKFSKPEGAYIGINTKKSGDLPAGGHGILEVSVADNGFGIPKAEQSKVFQKFFKYRGDNTLDVPGTGLGLFVVRMLIEKMGGKISFSSEEGKGTTFTFTLPLAK